MKRKCIVCGKKHDYSDLFCNEHRQLTDKEKEGYIGHYNSMLDDNLFIMRKKDIRMGIIIQERDNDGTFTKEPIFFMNGEKMKVNPPFFLRINENYQIELNIDI